MWKGEKDMRRFKSAPLDAAVTGPEELVQLKLVIALLISPINLSDCTNEWEHNRWNVLTLHCPLMSACSLYFNSSSQFLIAYALVFWFCFFPTTSGIFFILEVCEECVLWKEIQTTKALQRFLMHLWEQHLNMSTAAAFRQWPLLNTHIRL